ncbi:MAG: hypothetical protein LBR11_08270 [Deltaproteobacteria bacterium]|jgi:hypothetical protein|nr:hypothetical protein [Deltaproteobacteria bacterium]
MVEELIAFLNFQFELEKKATKLVEGDTVTTVSRWGVNWRAYLTSLERLGVPVAKENRARLDRYKSLQSGPELHQDLINFQARLRQTLRDMTLDQRLPLDFLQRVFRRTNGLPVFIEPRALNSDLNPNNLAHLEFAHSYETETYELYILAIIRDLIIQKRIFQLAQTEGVFFLAEPETMAEAEIMVEPETTAEAETMAEADHAQTSLTEPETMTLADPAQSCPTAASSLDFSPRPELPELVEEPVATTLTLLKKARKLANLTAESPSPRPLAEESSAYSGLTDTPGQTDQVALSLAPIVEGQPVKLADQLAAAKAEPAKVDPDREELLSDPVGPQGGIILNFPANPAEPPAVYDRSGKDNFSDQPDASLEPGQATLDQAVFNFTDASSLELNPLKEPIEPDLSQTVNSLAAQSSSAQPTKTIISPLVEASSSEQEKPSRGSFLSRIIPKLKATIKTVLGKVSPDQEELPPAGHFPAPARVDLEEVGLSRPVKARSLEEPLATKPLEVDLASADLADNLKENLIVLTEDLIITDPLALNPEEPLSLDSLVAQSLEQTPEETFRPTPTETRDYLAETNSEMGATLAEDSPESSLETAASETAETASDEPLAQARPEPGLATEGLTAEADEPEPENSNPAYSGPDSEAIAKKFSDLAAYLTITLGKNRVWLAQEPHNHNSDGQTSVEGIEATDEPVPRLASLIAFAPDQLAKTEVRLEEALQEEAIQEEAIQEEDGVSASNQVVADTETANLLLAESDPDQTSLDLTNLDATAQADSDSLLNNNDLFINNIPLARELCLANQSSPEDATWPETPLPQAALVATSKLIDQLTEAQVEPATSEATESASGEEEYLAANKTESQAEEAAPDLSLTESALPEFALSDQAPAISPETTNQAFALPTDLTEIQPTLEATAQTDFISLELAAGEPADLAKEKAFEEPAEPAAETADLLADQALSALADAQSSLASPDWPALTAAPEPQPTWADYSDLEIINQSKPEFAAQVETGANWTDRGATPASLSTAESLPEEDLSLESLEEPLTPDESSLTLELNQYFQPESEPRTEPSLFDNLSKVDPQKALEAWQALVKKQSQSRATASKPTPVEPAPNPPVPAPAAAAGAENVAATDPNPAASMVFELRPEDIIVVPLSQLDLLPAEPDNSSPEPVRDKATFYFEPPQTTAELELAETPALKLNPSLERNLGLLTESPSTEELSEDLSEDLSVALSDEIRPTPDPVNPVDTTIETTVTSVTTFLAKQLNPAPPAEEALLLTDMLEPERADAPAPAAPTSALSAEPPLDSPVSLEPPAQFQPAESVAPSDQLEQFLEEEANLIFLPEGHLPIEVFLATIEHRWSQRLSMSARAYF